MKKTALKFIPFLFLSLFFCASCSMDDEEEETKESITSISFSENNISIGRGTSKAVSLIVLPESRVNDCDVSYSLSIPDAGIIEISDTSSNGLIVSGKKSGSAVVIAKCEGLTAYLEVEVINDLSVEFPYISITEPVYEIRKGEKRTLTVGLAGGNETDNALFSWDVKDNSVCSIQSADNACVISGESQGYTIVEINHPKAEYPARIMIFVENENENPVYIKTQNPIFLLGSKAGTKNIYVNLANSVNNNLSLFTFEVTEGQECIDIIYNNNVLSVTPKKSGTALIKVNHSEARVPLEMRCIVVEESCPLYIDSEECFFEIKEGQSARTVLSVEGEDGSTLKEPGFTYEIENNEICDVSVVNSVVLVNAKKRGNTKVKISSPLCANVHELYVSVTDPGETLYYISSSTGLIKCEEGQSDIELEMSLAGGLPYDYNGFKWNVSDSSIISVATDAGEVTYARSAARSSVYNGNDFLDVKAYIHPLKTGTAEITLSHPKSSSDCKVKVVVYPEGTLQDTIPVVRGDSLIKVLKGSNKDITLSLISGKSDGITWEVSKNGIVNISGNGLSCSLFGQTSGTCTLYAKSGNKTIYSATVACGTQSELDNMNIISTKNNVVSIMQGKTGYYKIDGVSGDLSAVSSDPSVLNVSVTSDILVAEALKSGETTVLVKDTNASNELVMIFNIEPEIDLNHPYYFEYDKFASCVNGNNISIRASLIGADSISKNNIQWMIDDSEIASIEGNGENCLVTAKKTGKTVIYAHSDKSLYDARIVLYTADTQAELDNMCILDVSKTNYLCKTGDEIFIKVDVSEPEKNLEKITWESDDISVVKVQSNYNNAVLKCLSEGDCIVTVGAEGALPVKIFVTVRDEINDNVPFLSINPYCEMEEGESLKIECNIRGVNDTSLNNLRWEIKDSEIASINANGKYVYIKAKNKGFTNLNVFFDEYSLNASCSIIVYKPGDRHLPILTCENSVFKMKTGEIKDIRIGYGSVKPDETALSSIQYESNTDAVNISGSGLNFSVNAVHEGKSEVRVYGEGFYNELKLVFYVSDSEEAQLGIGGERIVRMLTGSTYDYILSVKDKFNNGYVNVNDSFDFETEGNDGIFNIEKIGTVLSITALKKGQCFMYITHPSVNERFKVLLYAADTQAELDNAFLMIAEKDHHLLSIGEECELKLEWFSDKYSSSGIKWSVNNSSICSYDINATKDTVKIKAKKEGEAVFTAKHTAFNGEVKFYVTVVKESIREKISMVTPSIVVLDIGEEEQITHNISIATSLSDAECQNLVWKSSDTSVISVLGNGKEAVLTGKKKGLCEVSVSYDSINTRTIVCKVVQGNEEYSAASLLNIDERYMVLRKGSSFSVKPFSKIKVCDFNSNVYEDLSSNNVIEVENRQGNLFIQAMEEGIAKINVSNPLSENSFDMFIEVRDYDVNANTGYNKGSLTTSQNLFALNIEEPFVSALLSVTPLDIEESLWSSITWSCSNDKCTLVPNGRFCSVYPDKEGVCDIKAESVYSENDVIFRVIIGNGEVTSIPCIKPEKNTLRLKSGETGELSFSLNNVSNEDVSKYSYSVDNSAICSIQSEGNRVSVKGLSGGQTVLNVSYEGLDTIHCVISVQGVIDNLVYLNCEESYYTVVKGYSRSVSVNLVGYNETNQNNFKWEYKNPSDSQYLTFKGSGKQIIVQGIKSGEVTLVCTHTNPDPFLTALCPIEVHISVIEDDSYKPVYIKNQGVVTINDGEKSTVKVSLVNGMESEYGFFQWKVYEDSKDIVKIVSSGNECVVTGLKPGIARLNVSHPSAIALPSVDLIVVVNENTNDNSLVITTDATIIEGKLSDSYKNVSVKLNGGTAEQALLFSWEIVSYESNVRNPDGTSNPVIQLVSQSGENNIIKYLREGTATVRVRNQATSHYLDIKFIINEYNNLYFETSNVTLDEFTSVTVKVESPSSKTIVYNSSDESIACVYGTNKVCCIEGVKAGYAVITARASDGSLSDTISVRVNKNTQSIPLHLVTNTNLVSFNTSDRQGTKLKGYLSGTVDGREVGEEEGDFISWSIKSGNNDVIKITGTDTLGAKGSEIMILPAGPGEETIVLSHPKCERTKEIYVSVTQSDASLILDELYGVFEKGDIGSVSARMSGVPASEENEIIWSIPENECVAIINEGEEVQSVKGGSCVFKCKELCEEGLVITCTYKELIKTYTVFIKALPSLHIMISNDTIRTGQSKWYNMVCSPEDYIGDLSYTFSSSSYIKTSENGVMMTGLVKDARDLALSKDNPPSDIRPPYFKVTGGMKEGTTSFNFECRNLTCVLNVKTDNTIMFDITSFDEYDQNGNIIQHFENPSIIEVSADSDHTRVYYNLEPEIDINQFMNDEFTAHLSNSFRDGYVTIKNIKNTGTHGRYFDLYPDSQGSNWGDIKLYAGETYAGSIRVSFTMKDAAQAFRFVYEDNVPKKYSYDIVNGYVRGAGKGETEYEGTQAYMTLDFSAPYFYAIKDYATEIYVPVSTTVNLFKDAKRFYLSSNYPNGNVITEIKRQKEPVLVEFEWPSSYGLTGKFSKYFIFYEEKWK